jgi:hypothetical protein
MPFLIFPPGRGTPRAPYLREALPHSISIYLHDPEGTLIEIYWVTGLDVKGPIGKPVDLSQPKEEILKAHLD